MYMYTCKHIHVLPRLRQLRSLSHNDSPPLPPNTYNLLSSIIVPWSQRGCGLVPVVSAHTHSNVTREIEEYYCH